MKTYTKYSKIAILISAVFLLSGCSLSGSGTTTSTSPATSAPVGAVSFLKTADGGKTWTPKVKINNQQNIAAVDVISMAIDPNNTNIIYIGTDSSGLFASKDGAESWQKLNFPLTKIYGVAVDSQNSRNIYASGLDNGRAKIYKSADSGTDWQEIYTEPASGTIITSLAVNRANSQIIYAGTDQGMIFASTDGGQTWKNTYQATSAVVSIAFDSSDGTVYFGIYTQGILRMKNGSQVEDLTQNIRKAAVDTQVYSVTADPSVSGTVYLGLDDAILKSKDSGDTWEKINILNSASKYPIWAMAINPQNSNEITYSSAGAIYKSTDGGDQWSTFQLASGKSVYVLKYDPTEPGMIYAGLKKS